MCVTHSPFFQFLQKGRGNNRGSVLCRVQSSEWSIFSNTPLWWVIQLMIQAGSMVCCWKIPAIFILNLKHTLDKHNECFMHLLWEHHLTVSFSSFSVKTWEICLDHLKGLSRISSQESHHKAEIVNNVRVKSKAVAGDTLISPLSSSNAFSFIFSLKSNLSRYYFPSRINSICITTS